MSLLFLGLLFLRLNIPVSFRCFLFDSFKYPHQLLSPLCSIYLVNIVFSIQCHLKEYRVDSNLNSFVFDTICLKKTQKNKVIAFVLSSHFFFF